MSLQTLNTPRETTHQRIADALEDIVDKIVDTSSADNIDYDNTTSGLSANKVQSAIDELALAGFVTNTVNNLVNYYLKSETYNKAEVDSLINAVKNSRFEAVSTLPTTNIKTNVIYLVPKSPTQTNNAKDEYINLDGTSSGWEKIGDTEVDLSGYVTTTALNTALSNYTTTANLTNLLNNKVDKVSGKGLSTNDYTDEEKSKLAGIASGAEVNVQSDWDQTTTTADDFIKNKPQNLVSDASYVHTDNNYTTTEKNKLSGIEAGAQVNTVTSVAGKTGAVTLVKGDVGLGNVDNTSDANKPISTATQTALNGKVNTSDIATSKTATGSLITLTDASNTNLIECVATISSSTSSVTITVKDTSTNPTVTNTYTIDLGQTVSSGTLDVVKGTLTTGGTIYNLPPTQIKLLKGNNVISSNVSSLSIKYQPDNALGTLKADIESEYDHLISKITPRTAKVYSFHISNSESDPSSKVTYLDDAVGMTPAKMNYSTGKFDYGSWKDIWFIKECKPCILAQAGYVMKYLDPDDYTKDIDGNTVTINGGLTGANIMIEFPKIWCKVTPDGSDVYSGTVSISPVKVNEGYKDYAYIDYQGHHKEHFYMPAYNGSNVNNVMRSISGQAVSKALDGQTEINYCKANGDGWYTEDAGEIMLINFLLILMGKSTDTQTVFGQGLHTGGSEAINNNFRTGVHNTKGLFYGTNSGTISDGNYANAVKIFGMENYWGFQWRRYAGDMLVNGVRKIKLCYGNEDGSSTFAFNGTGEGYVNINKQPSGTGGYINKMKFTHDGMYSSVSSGSSSTHYCDGQWINNNHPTIYALRGGSSNHGLHVGAFYVDLSNAFAGAWWNVGAAPSYK